MRNMQKRDFSPKRTPTAKSVFKLPQKAENCSLKDFSPAVDPQT